MEQAVIPVAEAAMRGHARRVRAPLLRSCPTHETISRVEPRISLQRVGRSVLVPEIRGGDLKPASDTLTGGDPSMTPGLGDRLKKLAKTAVEAERTLEQTQAVLQGRRPLSSISLPSSSTPSGTNAPAPPADLRCHYCGGIGARGPPKRP